MTRKLFVAAFLLRAACAVVTELTPIFPDYYYNDARYTDQTAAHFAYGGRSFIGSTQQRTHAAVVGTVYRFIARPEITAKLAKAALAAGGVALLYAAAAPVFGAGPAFAAAALTAVWPSHVFFTSQNFLEPLVFLLSALSIYFLLRSSIAGGALALAGLGLFRPYSMLLLALSAAATRRWALIAAATLGVAGQRLLNHQTIKVMPPPPYSADDISNQTGLVPTSRHESGRRVKPLSPQGLSEFRRLRMAAARIGRPVGTQIFPDLWFNTWLDVALFLPVGMFYALFMPLPGLYPLQGNVGRLLASVENLGLLVLVGFALREAVRRPWTAPRLLLLGFVGLTVAARGVFEFDLGSATRHKITFLPFLFPFAFARRPRPKREHRLVMQVIECGGPGGTGNQVSFLCRETGLDTVLVYNVREGRPEDYAGRTPAYHLPLLTREVSPVRDLRAFLALLRVMRDVRPDVVHAHSSKAGALARPAAWLAGVPLIYYSPHGYGFLQKDRGRLSRALYRLAERSVSWIGTIVAVSPGEAELAKPLAWGKPVELVPDAFLGEPGEPAAHEGLVVGACGRLTAARNPEAFARLAKAVPEARFVWIGDGGVRPAGVEVTGWLDAAAVRERMRGLDVLVHYSAWDALPNAVLEAMALGIPVVASEAARDALGEAGLYARDESELAGQVRRLLADPALRAGLGAAGRRRVTTLFSKATALERLRALYQA